MQNLLDVHQIFAFEAPPVSVEVSTKSALRVVHLLGGYPRAVHGVDGLDDVVRFVQNDHVALELNPQRVSVFVVVT